MSKKYISIIRVIERESKQHGRGLVKVWKIIKSDFHPDCVGEVTSCGLPMRARDVPIGTEYKSTLTIPE